NRATQNTLIMAGYARSLIALGGQQRLKQAVSLLETSTARDWRNDLALRDLGQAYAQLGQTGMANMVTAERHAMHGRRKEAKILAQRAADLLPRGSPGWRRAQDVLNAVDD
ncbi:MAG: peptidase M48, partial [Pseudomonadota bacterium]|nr:peptidase M48 [Pseudomonadota bacterium]